MRIVVVALVEIREDLLERGLYTLGAKLVVTALRPYLRRGGEEDLHLRAGKNDRSDVAPVHDDVVFSGNTALDTQQRRPDLRHG